MIVSPLAKPVVLLLTVILAGFALVIAVIVNGPPEVLIQLMLLIALPAASVTGPRTCGASVAPTLTPYAKGTSAIFE